MFTGKLLGFSGNFLSKKKPWLSFQESSPTDRVASLLNLTIDRHISRKAFAASKQRHLQLLQQTFICLDQDHGQMISKTTVKKTQGVRVGNPKVGEKIWVSFWDFGSKEGSPLVTLCCQILTKNPQHQHLKTPMCKPLWNTSWKTIKSTSTNLWHCINFSDPKVPKLLCITQRLVLLHLCFAVSLFQVGVCSETLPRAATAATITVRTAATQPPGCNVEFGPLAPETRLESGH